MGRPNVEVIIGNGGLGRANTSSDGVCGLVVTGAAVTDKLVLNKAYLLTSSKSLSDLGVTPDNNFLLDKEARAFFSKNNDSGELYVLVVSEATTLTAMCDSADGSPLRKLIDAGGGRIRLVGCNKIAPAEYEPVLDEGIDGDAITAAVKAQETYNVCAKRQRPFRLLIPACGWSGSTESLFKPRENSTNAVSFVLACDDATKKTAAIGQCLGVAASIKVHQSIGRVANGAVAVNGWATSGANFKDIDGLADILDDYGYIYYVGYTNKNGCYFNGDPTAAPLSDDYSSLRNGRVMDKLSVIFYTTYIDSILDNIAVESDGTLPVGACLSFESMLESAAASQMQGEISNITVTINPAQNILSTEEMLISAEAVPVGVIKKIKGNLALSNPANKQ